MNKFIITIISTLLLTVTGSIMAQDSDGEFGKKGRHHQRGIQADPIVDQVMRAIKRLDLDDEQKASIKSVMQTLKADTRHIMHETKAGHRQLRELIKAENYDEIAIAALAEKEGRLATERMILTSRALSEIYGNLTDEQRDELNAMADERMERRGERRKHRSEDENNRS